MSLLGLDPVPCVVAGECGEGDDDRSHAHQARQAPGDHREAHRDQRRHAARLDVADRLVELLLLAPGVGEGRVCLGRNARRPPHVGTEGISAFFDQTRSLADRIEMKLLDVIVCGTEAAMVLEIHATIGESVMIMDCVETVEFDDESKITRMKAYWDMSRARTRA